MCILNYCPDSGSVYRYMLLKTTQRFTAKTCKNVCKPLSTCGSHYSIIESFNRSIFSFQPFPPQPRPSQEPCNATLRCISDWHESRWMPKRAWSQKAYGIRHRQHVLNITSTRHGTWKSSRCPFPPWLVLAAVSFRNTSENRHPGWGGTSGTLMFNKLQRFVAATPSNTTMMRWSLEKTALKSSGIFMTCQNGACHTHAKSKAPKVLKTGRCFQNIVG